MHDAKPATRPNLYMVGRAESWPHIILHVWDKAQWLCVQKVPTVGYVSVSAVSCGEPGAAARPLPAPPDLGPPPLHAHTWLHHLIAALGMAASSTKVDRQHITGRGDFQRVTG